jgi:hypothetical protein
MTIFRKEKKPIILTLIDKAVVFSLGCCLLTLFLYAAGVRQGVTDRTQLLAIRAGVAAGFFLAGFSLHGLIFRLWFLIRRPSPSYLGGMAACLVSGAFGMVIAMAGTFVAALVAGNG